MYSNWRKSEASLVRFYTSSSQIILPQHTESKLCHSPMIVSRIETHYHLTGVAFEMMNYRRQQEYPAVYSCMRRVSLVETGRSRELCKWLREHWNCNYYCRTFSS
jgi:hypothetical protein